MNVGILRFMICWDAAIKRDERASSRWRCSSTRTTSLVAGVGAKLDSSLVDIVTGSKTPDAVCAFLDSEWQKAPG